MDHTISKLVSLLTWQSNFQTSELRSQNQPLPLPPMYKFYGFILRPWKFRLKFLNFVKKLSGKFEIGQFVCACTNPIFWDSISFNPGTRIQEFHPDRRWWFWFTEIIRTSDIYHDHVTLSLFQPNSIQRMLQSRSTTLLVCTTFLQPFLSSPFPTICFYIAYSSFPRHPEAMRSSPRLEFTTSADSWLVFRIHACVHSRRPRWNLHHHYNMST